jgi:hypothetical protein
MFIYELETTSPKKPRNKPAIYPAETPNDWLPRNRLIICIGFQCAFCIVYFNLVGFYEEV